MYNLLMSMSGEKCFTLTFNNPAEMIVDEEKVTIVYPSGNSLDIPRSMVVTAIDLLQRQGKFTVDDVAERITDFDGPRTDRLMAILRKLPGVTFDKRPRVLYYQSQEKL
jgi:hypothetical protein